MPLLADYAITPDVFDTTSYSSEEVCRLHLRKISKVMRREGLVRDLRAGDWRRLFANRERPWHRTGKELVKKLATQDRLAGFPAMLTDDPVNDLGWCAEALATQANHRLTGGVIVTDPVKQAYPSEPLVARIDRLSSTTWWTHRSSSVRLVRNLASYQRHLHLILRCANSLQFIDPHLDPTRYNYREFGDLIVDAGCRSPAPLIEIHRVCYKGPPQNRTILNVKQLEGNFRQELSDRLRAADLRADVFVWDDFHDRYLISNLMGISLQNGFDTTTNPRNITTWSRLPRPVSDDIQREFEQASGRHALRGRFSIP